MRQVWLVIDPCLYFGLFTLIVFTLNSHRNSRKKLQNTATKWEQTGKISSDKIKKEVKRVKFEWCYMRFNLFLYTIEIPNQSQSLGQNSRAWIREILKFYDLIRKISYLPSYQITSNLKQRAKNSQNYATLQSRSWFWQR